MTPTTPLDDLVRKFKGYCDGENAFDELDFKGAILDWVDKEIIGKDEKVTGHMRPQGYMSVDLTASYNNALRAEQRLRLRGK
jgi:hypothetical protein